MTEHTIDTDARSTEAIADLDTDTDTDTDLHSNDYVGYLPYVGEGDIPENDGAPVELGPVEPEPEPAQATHTFVLPRLSGRDYTVAIVARREKTASRVPLFGRERLSEDTVFDIKPTWHSDVSDNPDLDTHRRLLEDGQTAVDAIFKRRSMFSRSLPSTLEMQSIIKDPSLNLTYPVQLFPHPNGYKTAYPQTDDNNTLLPNQVRLTEQFRIDYQSLSQESRYTRMPEWLEKRTKRSRPGQPQPQPTEGSNEDQATDR